MCIGHSCVCRYDSSSSIAENGQRSGDSGRKLVCRVEEDVVGTTVEWQGCTYLRIGGLVKDEHNSDQEQRDRGPFACNEHDKADRVEAGRSNVVSYERKRQLG